MVTYINMGNMPSVFTSLSSFSVNEEVVSKIENELERLKEFFENDFPFQVQDMVNSTLSLIDDCSKKCRVCYNFYDKLTVLETIVNMLTRRGFD